MKKYELYLLANENVDYQNVYRRVNCSDFANARYVITISFNVSNTIFSVLSSLYSLQHVVLSTNFVLNQF